MTTTTESQVCKNRSVCTKSVLIMRQKEEKRYKALQPQQLQSWPTLSGFEVCFPAGCISWNYRRRAADLSKEPCLSDATCIQHHQLVFKICWILHLTSVCKGSCGAVLCNQIEHILRRLTKSIHQRNHIKCNIFNKEAKIDASQL